MGGEIYSVTLAEGKWLSIGRNGLNVLKTLDKDIFLDIVRKGYLYLVLRIKRSDDGIL